MSKLFFTSDEHFGHNNIIKFCNRPFADMDQMVDSLIYRHNLAVGAEDRVYHLGDMFWRTFPLDRALAVMKALNGEHHYIRGNHEELVDENPALQECFVTICERAQIYPEGAPRKGIVLDHYAGRVWHDSDKGAWQLYGHTHADLTEMDPLLAFDVGVDANDFMPVSLEQVAWKMQAKRKRVVRNLGLSDKSLA